MNHPPQTLSSQIAAAHAKPVHDRPRVLVVAFQSGKQADGGTESLTQLLEHYRRTRVTVLSHRSSAKTARWARAGHRVRLRVLPYEPGSPARGKGKLLRLWSHVVWNFQAAWMALEDGVEAAHINDPHALWHTALGLRLAGVPVVYNIRDTKPALTRREVLKWRLAFGLSQSQIVLSREMAGFWRKAVSRPLPHMEPVYSVIPFERMTTADGERKQTLREELGISAGWAVGYVASFSPKKAQLLFLERGGPLLKTMLGAGKIYFLGDFDPENDPYAAACARAAVGLEGRVHFQGFVSEVHRWYPALDAVVVATQNEGLARCMIEGLACGVPVVSFDVCSAREILEGKSCGAVVPQGDYEGLIAVLRSLLENPDNRARLGGNGACAARQLFDPTANTEAYENHYRRLSERGPCS